MDQRTHDYLIRAHNKVIAHYQNVLGASSLSQAERERIQQRLASVQAEFEAFKRRKATGPTQVDQAA